MNEASRPKYSIVIPVYRNSSSIKALIARLEDLVTHLPGDMEAVFVVDGSPDDCAAQLEAVLPTSPVRGQLIILSRNFGSFSAIQAGLGAARGDYVCVMAADLQEPMEFVVDAFAALTANQADVVIGQRRNRGDSSASAGASRAFWTTYRAVINPDIPAGGVDIFASTSQVAKQLAAFTEAHTSLVGLLFWMGYRRLTLPYDRAPRHSGRSAWTFRKKLRYLLDSVYAFTDLPIVFLQVTGAIGFLLSGAIGLVVLIGWIAGFIASPGYTPLMLVITGSTSLILLGLGVVGSYTWRAYENGKARPRTIVDRKETYG